MMFLFIGNQKGAKYFFFNVLYNKNWKIVFCLIVFQLIIIVIGRCGEVLAASLVSKQVKM